VSSFPAAISYQFRHAAVTQIFCSACSSEKMDGTPFGVPHSLRVCVKCKAFEKSMPSKGGRAGVLVSALQSTPPAPTPFVPLFAPALHPDDTSARFDLEAFGADLIRTLCWNRWALWV
jgi:hypothetical protein